MTTEDLKRVDELIKESESDFEYQPPSGEGYETERSITIMEGIYRSNLAIAMMLRDQSGDESGAMDLQQIKAAIAKAKGESQ
jgi:hypothetical protein